MPKENQNKKILEELQKKQQALKGQPNASASNLTTITKTGLASLKPQISNPTSFNQIEFTHHLANSQPNSNGQREKAALNYALHNSFGNYISQDSSFGNQVIPVLPLFKF